MMKDSTRKTITTVVANVLTLAAAAPMIADALGVDRTVGWGAALVGGSAALVRLFETPAVRQLMDRLLGHRPSEPVCNCRNQV
jgi:hypothetical protein